MSTTPPAVAIDGDLLTRALRHPVGAAGWLMQHREGQLQAERTEALAELLLACAETDKPGEVTLRIRIQSVPEAMGQMLLADRIVTKLPPRATARPFLFDPDAMRITGERPGQLSIPLSA